MMFFFISACLPLSPLQGTNTLLSDGFLGFVLSPNCPLLLACVGGVMGQTWSGRSSRNHTRLADAVLTSVPLGELCIEAEGGVGTEDTPDEPHESASTSSTMSSEKGWSSTMSIATPSRVRSEDRGMLEEEEKNGRE
eukprot:TRINITY_DN33376_c0_g1_i1.p2 TRINITY_DN33376_c0_g1~~TRINITY_DN33376_c0_g1_i1.p2  ORF type:complete len:137 (+),score=11.67 TRINITY_DN33376_c0_g1_i1:198-608(+)